jgi:hypothetical protein
MQTAEFRIGKDDDRNPDTSCPTECAFLEGLILILAQC